MGTESLAQKFSIQSNHRNNALKVLICKQNKPRSFSLSLNEIYYSIRNKNKYISNNNNNNNIYNQLDYV